MTQDTNQRAAASPFGGSEQVIDMINDRWRVSVLLPSLYEDDAAVLESYINAMRGQVNHTELYHYQRPVPRGTLRGSPFLLADAVQGTDQLTLFVTPGATLLPGDLIGLDGMILQCRESCTADDAGVLVVPLANRLRRSVSGFRRNSIATYINENGLFSTAVVNEPRFQWKRVLTEASSTNLVLYSSGFDNPYWVKDGSVTFAPGQPDPFGGSSALKMNEAATSGNHVAYRLNLGGAGAHTVSFYAKAVERSWVRVSISGVGAFFNLGTGVVGSVQSGCTASISSAGGGWYRISVTRTVTEASSVAIRVALADNSDNYLGVVGAGVLVWGAQYEALATPSSYIPTTTAPATRPDRYEPVLIEAGSTNLISASEDFLAASWVRTNVLVQVNATTSPAGTNTADKVVWNGANTFHEVWAAFSSTAGVRYCGSYYVKAAEHRYVQLLGPGSVFAEYANFDIVAGTRTDGTPGFGAITPVGDGWFRISLSSVALSSSTTARIAIGLIPSATSGRALAAAGDGVSGVYLWGAQLEQSSAATSYIPTTTSAATRLPLYETELLVEGEATNLLAYSQDFSNGVWTKTRSSVSANVATAPDGSASADRLTEDSSNGQHWVGSSVGMDSAVATIYAKADTRTRIGVLRASNSAGAVFDLSSGTFTITASGYSASIEPLAGGWYRCRCSGNFTSGVYFPLYSAGGALSYTGDGSGGLYIWGAQLEVGASPTSYIPTTTAPATRAADTLPSPVEWDRPKAKFRFQGKPSVRYVPGFSEPVSIDFVEKVD